MFGVFSKLALSFLFIQANAKILAWFVYSGEKDKRSLLGGVRSTGEKGRFVRTL
jgi:hypothetical protein